MFLTTWAQHQICVPTRFVGNTSPCTTLELVFSTYKADHAKNREKDAQDVDTHRQIGYPNKVISNGRQVTPFKNPKKNTQKELDAEDGIHNDKQ